MRTGNAACASMRTEKRRQSRMLPALAGVKALLRGRTLKKLMCPESGMSCGMP